MNDLKTWLQRTPVPVTLRVYDDAGESRPVRVGTGPQRWRDALSACRDASRVDALDRENVTLRSWSADDAAPAVAPPAQHSGSMGDLVLIARLLSEAADKAAERHGAAYKLAFDKQAELLTIIADRLASLERVYAKLLGETAMPAPAPAPDPNEAMAMQLLSGVLMNQGQHHQGGKPNG